MNLKETWKNKLAGLLLIGLSLLAMWLCPEQDASGSVLGIILALPALFAKKNIVGVE